MTMALIAGGIGACVLLVLFLRRRGRELHRVRVELAEQKDECKNSQVRNDIASVEQKAEQDEKNALEKEQDFRNVLSAHRFKSRSGD